MTEFSTVREGRHAARDAIETAHTVLTARLDAAITDVHVGIHDALQGTAGAKGLSQDEQVSILSSMIDSCDKIETLLPAMQTALVEAAEATANDVRDAVVRAREAIAATKALAASRDFEAHQAAKPEPTEDEASEGFTLDPQALLSMLFGGPLPEGFDPAAGPEQKTEDEENNN